MSRRFTFALVVALITAQVAVPSSIANARIGAPGGAGGTTVPALSAATCLDLREVQVQFDQPMATTGTTSITDISHYALSGGLFVVAARALPGNTGAILTVGRSTGPDPNDGNAVSTDPATFLANGPTYTVTASNVASASFQFLTTASATFGCTDTAAPTVAAPEQPGAGTTILTFSKPMDPPSVEAALTWDGTALSTLANFRWRGNFTDASCGALVGCFTSLAIHARGFLGFGAHTLVVGGTDAAGHPLAGTTTFTVTVGTPPTVTGVAVAPAGNGFRLNVDFSESMASTRNGYPLAAAIENRSSYVLRNPDGSPATTGGAAGVGTAISVALVNSDGDGVNAPRFRIKRARVFLAAGGSGTPTIDPAPLGGAVPVLQPNIAYTLDVAGVQSEAGVPVARTRLTVTWPGDNAPLVALRAYVTGTGLAVDYNKVLYDPTNGTLGCLDEGGSAANVPFNTVTNVADPARYHSPDPTLDAALATMSGCQWSDDLMSISFTFAAPIPIAQYELDIAGVRDPFGNALSPDPTALLTVAPGSPPALAAVTCLDLRQVQVQFDQPMVTNGAGSAVDLSHYALSGLSIVGVRTLPGNTGVIATVGRSTGPDPNDGNPLSADPATFLANGPAYTLSVRNVASASYHVLPSAALAFSCADAAAPTVAAPERAGSGTIILSFSKPMAPLSVQSALTWDGAPASSVANLRWQDFSDQNCAVVGCFTTLAIHSRGAAFAAGAHTLVVGGTDAAGHALTGSTTFTVSIGTPPTVVGTSLQVVGNLFRLNVDFSESMAATMNGFSPSVAINTAANYILRNPDGSPATTGGAAGVGAPITVLLVQTDGNTANFGRSRITRAQVSLTAGGSGFPFGAAAVGGVVPTLKPGTAYTLDVVNVQNEAFATIAPNHSTFSWPGDTTPPAALRAFVTPTTLYVDYGKRMLDPTRGTLDCLDEGGSPAAQTTLTNAADPRRYGSPDPAFRAALAAMSGCRSSDDGTGVSFTFASPITPGQYELDIAGVQDPLGNLLAPNPTVLTTNTTAVAAAPLRPALSSVSCLDLRQIQVNFNQTMSTAGTASLFDVSHYALPGFTVVGARALPGNAGAILTIGRSVGPEADDGNTLSADPATFLANGGSYTLTVSKVASASYQLVPAASAPFTCADPTAPTVATLEQPGSGTIVVTFSKPMDPASVQAALTWDGAPAATVANVRWQDLTDNNCGSGNGCFTTLALHARGPASFGGAHTLVVGGNDAAGHALTGTTTYHLTSGTAPTVQNVVPTTFGNQFQLNVNFSESMASTKTGWPAGVSIDSAANYVLRNPDGSPATTGGAAGVGTPITVGLAVTDNERVNARLFRITRARLSLAAGGTGTPGVNPPPTGGILPVLKPNTSYTLEVVGAENEGGIPVAAGNRATFSWPGDTAPFTALRAFVTGTRLIVDYSKAVFDPTNGTLGCLDEGGSAGNIPFDTVTNVADPSHYHSPDPALNAALATMTGCQLSDDFASLGFTLGSPVPAGQYELDITGVQDPFGNAISPNPTVLLTVASTTPPALTAVTCLDLRQVQVQFDQPMATTGGGSMTDLSHYAIPGLSIVGARALPDGTGVIVSVGHSVDADANDGAKLSADPATYLANGPGYTLNVANVASGSFQLLASASAAFSCNDTSAPTLATHEQPGLGTLVLTFSKPMAPSSVQSALTWDGAALSTLGVMRWQDISDNNCGSGNGCFTTLAIHANAFTSFAGVHTLGVGGTDAAGHPLAGPATIGLTIGTPPTVRNVLVQPLGNALRLAVNFSESMASTRNSWPSTLAIDTASNYVLRNPDGSPATTGGAAGLGTPITIGLAVTGGERVNSGLFRLTRARLLLAAGGTGTPVLNPPPVGGVVPVLAPNVAYTLEVLNAANESGVPIAAGNRTTFQWSGDTAPLVALRAFVSGTKLLVDYNKGVFDPTNGTLGCLDEGLAAANVPFDTATNVADRTRYHSSDPTLNAALAGMTACQLSDDLTGLSFTLGSPVPAGQYELDITGVQDAFGNALSPNPTALTTNANTQTGANVTTAPVDSTTGTSPVTLTFSAVTGGGDTTLTSSTTGPTPPAGFQVSGTYFDIATTAAFTPPITVCSSYTGATAPRLFHFEGGAWVDVTTSTDTTNHVVCGSVSSLSPFALLVDQRPTIHGTPSSQTLEATGRSGAVATWTVPTATDAFGNSVPVSCDPASGSTFAIDPTTAKTTRVTCTATDAAGNSTSTSFTITVVDTQRPAISGMPANLSVEATGPAGAVVTWSAPTATDIVDGGVAVTCTPASGSTFAIDPTTSKATLVTCTATDAHGNTAAASFTVTVRDTIAPSLTLPASLSVDATGPSGAAVTYAASATDLVDGADSVGCTVASGSTFPVGVTTVSCSSTDKHGNVATGSFSVTVRGAAAQLADLAAIVCAGVGPGGSLCTKVTTIQTELTTAPATACSELNALSHEISAQTGKSLTIAQAADLAARTDRIRAALGCP